MVVISVGGGIVDRTNIAYDVKGVDNRLVTGSNDDGVFIIVCVKEQNTGENLIAVEGVAVCADNLAAIGSCGC